MLHGLPLQDLDDLNSACPAWMPLENISYSQYDVCCASFVFFFERAGRTQLLYPLAGQANLAWTKSLSG